jgi:uncharacterized protein with NAD-binding domain and iron-sulfur cluster
MKKNIIVLGGGVAGMSAAHELMERGYQVTVFEKKFELPGGKARSIPIKETATSGRLPLPGEHGFRFFPGFYKHITDTMKRIPFKGNKNGVYDNLVECPVVMIARNGKLPLIFPNRFPQSLSEILQIVRSIFSMDTGLKPGESNVIAMKIWQLMTSSKERRLGEYENLSWLCYTEADKYSEAYRTLFVAGLTRTLVAAKAELCNTKTNGDVLLQLLFHFTNPNVPNDRILNAPTNDAWLMPWLHYLQEKGVDYHFNAEVTGIESNATQIDGITVNESGMISRYQADYYICAMPVERIAVLLQKNVDLFRLDPGLKNILELSNHVAWMNGVQFFLNEDVKLNNGHIILVESPWALTAISQAQFWKNVDLSKYGNAKVKGIISIDVSDWDTVGVLHGLPAKKCNKGEVMTEVWAQLKQSMNINGDVLKDEMIEYAYLDEAIIFADQIANPQKSYPNSKLNEPAKYGSNEVSRNEEPLLINRINTWEIRCEAKTAIPNLFLASDYVKTNTDLATMEGANEAARRATNALLEVDKSEAPGCALWELHEPDWLLFNKWLDKRRYKKGLPWKNYSPWLTLIPNLIFKLFSKSS